MVYPTETTAEYQARQERCREIAATLTEAGAMEILVGAAGLALNQMAADTRDQFVAANMRLRGAA